MSEQTVVSTAAGAGLAKIDAAQADIVRLEREAQRIATDRARVASELSALEAGRGDLARIKVNAIGTKDEKQARRTLGDHDDRIEAARVTIRDLDAASTATAAALTAARDGLALAQRKARNEIISDLIERDALRAAEFERLASELARIAQQRLQTARTIAEMAATGDRSSLTPTALCSRMMEPLRFWLAGFSDRQLEPSQAQIAGRPYAPFHITEAAVLDQFLDHSLEPEDEP